MQKLRRNRPGTKRSELWNWPLEEYSNMSGPFAVQEYIQELIRANPSDIKKIIEPPPDVDISVWQYEHMRQFILELNLLVVYLENICTMTTCPKMKATDEWLYLCASHKTPQECSAIDYMTHTLDHATALIQNSKNFNSRVSVPPTSIKYLVSIVRRLYRLFTHTYYHHREIFTEFEKEFCLCARFTEFVLRFDMMQAKLFSIPSHALQCSKV
uniref:Phocein n=1 Tax=Stentor coeruleus TaxID=5963 RepID=A0A060BG52_9CILI|nr:phocein [Stentor coeruleus]